MSVKVEAKILKRDVCRATTSSGGLKRTLRRLIPRTWFGAHALVGLQTLPSFVGLTCSSLTVRTFLMLTWTVNLNILNIIDDI